MRLNELSIKEQNIYENLKRQIDNDFKHINSCAHGSRRRYKSSMYDFAKFLAKVYKKQKISKIKNVHIKAYVKFLKNRGCSESNVASNVSGIRYYYKKTLGSKFSIWNNTKLGVLMEDEEIEGSKRFK